MLLEVRYLLSGGDVGGGGCCSAIDNVLVYVAHFLLMREAGDDVLLDSWLEARR